MSKISSPVNDSPIAFPNPLPTLAVLSGLRWFCRALVRAKVPDYLRAWAAKTSSAADDAIAALVGSMIETLADEPTNDAD